MAPVSLLDQEPLLDPGRFSECLRLGVPVGDRVVVGHRVGAVISALDEGDDPGAEQLDGVQQVGVAQPWVGHLEPPWVGERLLI